MALHYKYVKKEPDGTYRAFCQCGWKGEPKKSKSGAERDWDRNHPNMPERYA